MDSCNFQTSFPYGGYTTEGYTNGEDNIVDEPGIGHEYCYNPPTTGADTHSGFMNVQQHHIPQHHGHQQHGHPVARSVRATLPVSSAADTSVAQNSASLIAHPDIMVPWSPSNTLSSPSGYKYFSEYTDSHEAVYPRPSTSPGAGSDSSPSTSHSTLPDLHYGNRQNYHHHPPGSGTLLLSSSGPCFSPSENHLIVGESLRQSSSRGAISGGRVRNHSLPTTMPSVPHDHLPHQLVQHPYYQQPFQPPSPRRRPAVTTRHIRKLNSRLIGASVSPSSYPQPPSSSAHPARSPPYTLPSPPLTTPPSPKLSEVDCYTCRRRRVKCGRELPHCTKCDKADRPCLGYTKPLVWNKGVASRGKMMGKSYGEDQSPPPPPKKPAQVKNEHRTEISWASPDGTGHSEGTGVKVAAGHEAGWKGYERNPPATADEGYVVRWEERKEGYCT